MNKATERILEAIEKLDLSPTMFEDATSKYKNVCNYLGSKGIEAEFYPEGSFSQGTVIRPFTEGKDLIYDLDVVCQVLNLKCETTPKDLKHSIGNALKETAIYQDRLAEEYQTCWTIEYVGIGNFDFNLDIVPAVHQDNQEIVRLVLSGLDTALAIQAISITNKQNSNHYEWVPSNPRGLDEWFNRINQPFFNSVATFHKEIFFKSNTDKFASVDDVPDYVVKSNLQRSIQFLKRHRDIYFYRIGDESNKPKSIVITVLLGSFVKNVDPSIPFIDLLSNFVEVMLLERPITGANPSLLNPSDPRENLVSKWNTTMINGFYNWLESLRKDLMKIQKDGVEALKSVDSVLFTENLGLSKQYDSSEPKKITVPTKPWQN